MRHLPLGLGLLLSVAGCNAKSHSPEATPEAGMVEATAATPSLKASFEADASAATAGSHSTASSATQPGETSATVTSLGPATDPGRDASQMNDAGTNSPDATLSGPSELDAGGGPDAATSATGTPAPSVASAAASHDDPFSLPEKCSSGEYWKQGAGEHMRPGEACIACHALGYAGPIFAFAGTVYNRGHEPDDCNGVLPAEGIVVEITDANNVKTKLHTNNAGNFMLLTPVALPYTARVLNALGERRMLTPQTSGDCNSCHSSAGKNGAPGRIAVP